MSLVNDKKSIVNEISVLSSIGKTVKVPDQNYTYPSVSNKNEPIPFMLDLLTALIGSEALQRTTGEVMGNFVRSAEPELKTSLKKQTVTYNSSEQLPSNFSSGYNMPVKDFDKFGKLKNSPSSSAGNLLYGNTANTFDKKAYEAIMAAGSDVAFGNVILNYNENTDQMQVRPANTSQTIGSFVNGYIDSIKLLDEKEFTTMVLDTIFGTTSANQKKTVKAMAEEEKYKKLIEKISNGEDSTLTENDLREINEAAENKLKSSVPVDVGCSIIESVLSISDITNLINANVSTSDPVSIGNNFNNMMENSFGKIPGQVNPKNKNAIRDGFFKRLIKTISNTLVMALTATPQIRVLMLLIQGFKNNGNVTPPASTEDDVNGQKNFIICISKKATQSLNKFIFEILKRELLKIIIPVTRLIVKEKLQGYIRIIQNLIL